MFFLFVFLSHSSLFRPLFPLILPDPYILHSLQNTVVRFLISLSSDAVFSSSSFSQISSSFLPRSLLSYLPFPSALSSTSFSYFVHILLSIHLPFTTNLTILICPFLPSSVHAFSTLPYLRPLQFSFHSPQTLFSSRTASM